MFLHELAGAGSWCIFFERRAREVHHSYSRHQSCKICRRRPPRAAIPTRRPTFPRKRSVCAPRTLTRFRGNAPRRTRWGAPSNCELVLTPGAYDVCDCTVTSHIWNLRSLSVANLPPHVSISR
jgi:hypothetical protein